MSALPQLLEAARSGYMARCVHGGGGGWGQLLRVRYCADPDQAPGEGRETTLWFHPDTHALERGGDHRGRGLRVIRCALTEFTMGT